MEITILKVQWTNFQVSTLFVTVFLFCHAHSHRFTRDIMKVTKGPGEYNNSDDDFCIWMFH